MLNLSHYRYTETAFLKPLNIQSSIYLNRCGMMIYFHIYSTFYVRKNLIERDTREKIMVIMPIYNFLYVLVPEKTIILTILIMMFQARKAFEQILGHVCLTSLHLRTTINMCSASTSI